MLSADEDVLDINFNSLSFANANILLAFFLKMFYNKFDKDNPILGDTK